MFLYVIRSPSSDRFYIGITQDLQRRAAAHKAACGRLEWSLYSWMRKYSDWVMETAYALDTRDEAKADERFWLAFGKTVGWKLLNITDGGDGGFAVPKDKRDAWIGKLREARKGNQPFLGKKHSEESKRVCGNAAKRYWESQDTYDPFEVLQHSFLKAREKFGISKTHYYRLKRALASDQC